MGSTAFICAGCGTQFELAAAPPSECPVCLDDRQYVPADGQRWTTHDELAAVLHERIEEDGDLLGVGLVERFAIPQRALLLHTDIGNVLWDCISVLTPAARAEIEALGGVDLIAISHPHFYSSMVEWSDAFGAPVLLHEADRNWVRRSSPSITFWSGDAHVLSPTVRLIQLPGHFPGSAALHWSAAPGGRRALLTGDSLLVAADRRHVSVMHSVPNHVPLGPAVIDDLARRLDGVEFDDLYGFAWGGNVIGDADAAVTESLARYRAAITSPSLV